MFDLTALARLAAGTLFMAAIAGSAMAQTAAPAAAPAATPFSYDPKLFDVAPSGAGAKPAKPAQAEGDNGGKLKLPDPVRFGKSTLQFDTERSEPSARVGVERFDPTVLNQGTPALKTTPLNSGYFGLKITTPTH